MPGGAWLRGNDFLEVMFIYSADEFAKVGFKYIGTSYETMDCQKFVERCMADVGLKMDLPGSNAWYRKMDWVGTPEECKARFGCIPKGALLFILEAVSDSTPAKYREDGIGDANHIGIKTGQGKGAIHSSKSRGGVCESDFRDKTIPNGGWTRVGLYGKFDYAGVKDLVLEAPGGTEGTVFLCSTELEQKRPSPSSGETAVVVAERGTTVNMRKTKSTSGKLVERVPIGSTVTVLRTEGKWSRVVYTDPSGAVWCGWMVSGFLRSEAEEGANPPESTPLYAVTIPFLTEENARALLRTYSGAWMTKEEY